MPRKIGYIDLPQSVMWEAWRQLKDRPNPGNCARIEILNDGTFEMDIVVNSKGEELTIDEITNYKKGLGEKK